MAQLVKSFLLLVITVVEKLTSCITILSKDRFRVTLIDVKILGTSPPGGWVPSLRFQAR